MSHQVPDYYRYVSSIEIVNPGSGYTSVPTITISGGGGTGATATASILNGQIQAVNITNIGRDYTSSPTVTATGGGANATFKANLAFAAGTPTDYTEKSSIGIKYTLPEFIQNDYDRFVTFIEKYYEFMDSDGNPANLLLNKTYNDIDELENAELNKRAEELAYHFPQILQTDRKALLKKIKNIYESKGSERSIKAYFKLLYNEEVEVYYPSQNILRASDGVWIEETSVRATPGFNNYEVLELSGMLADIKYHETVGSVPLLRTIPVTIPRVEKLSYTSPQAYEVVLELPPGITEIPGPGAQASASATVSPIETEYNNGAIINVTGDGSDFFKREVTVNGVRIMGAGTVGGQQAVPDAWLEKVARMFELFLDPNGAGINETLQRNVIKTLSGDSGTYHAAQGPTLQRVARGAGSDYTPNFLTDEGIASWNLSPLFDAHVANDMVWYLNSTGDGYGIGEIDAQEVIEHVFHTLHMHGLDAVSLKMYPYISADWATGPLYTAMVEAYDGGYWDPAGYGGAAFKTDADAFEVAAKEYLYLLNFSMFEYTGLWDGDSLAPEWADTVRTAAQIQTNLPLGYALFNSYISPAISKPSLTTINSIFGDGNTPAQDDPSLAGASGYVVDTVGSGEITQIQVNSQGYDYTAAPEVQIFDPIGTGAEARAIVSEGKVTSISVTSGGSNYTGTNTTVNLSVDNLRTFIVERGASSDLENIRAYLDRSLALVSSGTYSGDNAGFSVGDVFSVNESGNDGAAYVVDGYFAEDYTFSGGSNNAVIRVAAVDSKSVPTSWSIINPGEGFINSETVITIESKTGVSLDITFYTKYLYSYDGKYKDDRGKLSDVNRLQDNYKYQSYSYIIKSTVSQNQWVKKFREIMHPAGMEVFGDLIISSNINFAPFISITTQGLNLLEFKTEDIVISNSDELSINYSKPFANTTSNSDLFELLIESSKVDTVTTNDAGAVTYFAEDYCDLTYCREGGVEILVSKVFDEDTSTLDVFVPVMSYIRTFSDTSSADDIGQVTYFSEDYCDLTYCSEGGTEIFVDKVLDEEILSAVDNFSYEKYSDLILDETLNSLDEVVITLENSFNNTITSSEISVININKELVENQTATESAEINTDKTLSETGTMSESVYISKQDYSDPTYFSEDYVGAVYSF